MRNTLGRVFSPILSRSASLTFLAFRRFIVQPGINPNLTDYIEPTSQHGLDKYPPHVPTIYKNTHLASIEQTVYGPYQGFGRHPFSRVTDTRNQAGQQGQGHRLFLSPDHPGQADPALASYILRQIRLVAMLMMNLAPRRLLRGAKRQGIIDHQVNDFLLHDLQYQSDKLSRQPQPGPAPFLQPFVITAPVIAHRDDQVGFGYKACWGEHRPDQQFNEGTHGSQG